MTRINTNVSALVAEQNLNNSNTQLQITLTRLSTGLRINSGADDPSGMIAATDLGSNIAATQQAIANSQSASQLISTADSALSQVSSLLTTINGLINQTANTATMSSSQIAANQLQIDSSLSAINTIAQTTTFQGQNLLNGNLSFKTAAVQNYGQIQNLRVSQVNFGMNAVVPVDISVTALAKQARVNAVANDGVGGTVKASSALSFFDTSGLTITAPATGVSGNAIIVKFNETATQAAGTASASFNQTNQTLTINVNNTATTVTTGATIQAAINTATPFVAAGGDAVLGYTSGTDNANFATFTLGTTNTPTAIVATAGTGVAGLVANAAMEIAGNNGTQLFSFQAGATAQQMATAINQATAGTGVTATYVGDFLEVNSSTYGSAAKASVHVVSEAAGGTFNNYLIALNPNGTDSNGTDIKALVNGTAATGVANTVSLDTPSLAFSAALNPNQVAVDTGGTTPANDIKFNITGGGALFQLGPIVSSAQQANLGIQSIDTGSLGGVVEGPNGPQVGLLYELGSGQDAALSGSGGLALSAQIVQAALDNITSLRGQLGAFQSETLNSNISSLTNAVTNLTAAHSSIQDADFAAESANLSREQILVQSGTTVAGIASSTPANVLSLLQKAAQV